MSHEREILSDSAMDRERDNAALPAARQPAGSFPARMLLALAALALTVLVSGIFGETQSTVAAPPAGEKLLDPAAWGSDHVGELVPEYTEGGECLFCHRHEVGVTWDTNKHNRTIRDADPSEPAMAALAKEFAAGKDEPKRDAEQELIGQAQLLLGDTRAQRFLRRSAAYGHVDMLTVRAEFGRGSRAKLNDVDDLAWDTETFATQCAGCHATAVDPETHAFSTVALDCYACHGDATVEHATDPTLMPLAKARKDSPAAVTSICASCHIRFGKSKASGLPYPTNFVAGDNLFKDFEVDWSVLDNEDPKTRLNPADAHVMENIRDVVLLGNESTTCLTCHDVHASSSAKHRLLPVTRYCQHCHTASDPIRAHKNYSVHSERCRY